MKLWSRPCKKTIGFTHSQKQIGPLPLQWHRWAFCSCFLWIFIIAKVFVCYQVKHDVTHIFTDLRLVIFISARPGFDVPPAPTLYICGWAQTDDYDTTATSHPTRFTNTTAFIQVRDCLIISYAYCRQQVYFVVCVDVVCLVGDVAHAHDKRLHPRCLVVVG